MKKIVFTLLVFAILFGLCGCAKCIKTETKTVEVKIIDEYHRGVYVTPMRCGKVTTLMTHPAVYEITVEYNGEEYTISGSDTYNKYKDKIGETTNATLEIRTYDDESTKYNITELK